MGSILDLISKVGAQEKALTSTEFISPVFFNTKVATRVSGMVYTFEIPKTKPGWYCFHPIDHKRAEIKGEAGLDQVEQYQKRLPKVRATVSLKKGRAYMAVVEKNSKEFLGRGIYVLLPDDSVSDFDRVIVRYDGCNLWYESPDTANDPSKSEYLRESLSKLVPAEKLYFSGLLFDEKAAYAFRTNMDKEYVEEVKKDSIQKDVEHAGGKLVKYSEKSDHYSVTFSVDGHKYTSYISKDPSHQVITAGICLAGTDKRFDLRSLITVMREGQHEGLIHRFDNTEE